MALTISKSQFAAIRAISGISIMATIGIYGYFEHELELLFMHGTPFPLIFIIIFGIIIETIGLLTCFIPFKKDVIHEPTAHITSINSLVIYVFGSIAICVYLALFFLGYSNFMVQPPGGSNNPEWAPIIFMTYIGIVAQIYLMYKILKKDEKSK